MHKDHRTLLGNISPAEFLHTYWQKKPCLIRQAMPGFSPFISRHELMLLASDERVESRIVLEKDGDYPWQVLHGPFDAANLSMLPASHWTLLVQGVNLHDARAAALLQRFSFIPNWRIDDLMISYAPDYGSVGAHLDSYDVFLLQALGHRHWRISTHDYSERDFLPGADLRIIEHFVHEQEWGLEPGDMLYLPPGIAHHGIAREACMTFSIGFRAPTQHELLTRYLEDRYENGNDIQYGDPDLEVPHHRGEIQRHSLDRIKDIMRSALADPSAIESWFGCYITSLPEQLLNDISSAPVDAAEFRKILTTSAYLQLHHSNRSVFFQNGEELHLFVNGAEYRVSTGCRELVHSITGTGTIDSSILGQSVPGECAQLLHDLYNKGILISR